MTDELPKIGDRVPLEKFHISSLNIRAGEPFGEAEEDQLLITNLRAGKIIGPFRARPENTGYGVVVGRRRFLAKKVAGAKDFVVGVDCLIEEMTDEEAREISLVENLDVLRRTMNPIRRAKGLKEIVTHSSQGLRETSRRLGIPPSNLSEWLKILELSPKLQDAISKGLLGYTDGLMVARTKLNESSQNDLAETLESKGIEAFRKELMRVNTGKMKRGIPEGVYEIARVVWDTRDQKQMRHYQILTKVAREKEMNVPEYIKDFIIRHIDEIQMETT